MSLLKKLFGPKDPVEEMRRCHSRQDWAGVLSVANRLETDSLDEQAKVEISAWEQEAGDALAAINIDEGLWAHKSGNLLRAREDFQLAIEQARSEDLKKRAKQALTALEKGELPKDAPVPQERGQSSCASCAPEAIPDEAAGEDLDTETRMELLLATMEPELAERYLAAGPDFKKAWLTAQEGDEKQALKLLNAVPEDERNALFLYERGSLQARNGQAKKSRQDLQAALTLEPEFFPAFEALVDVLFSGKRWEEIERLLKQAIADERFSGYGWARMAELDATRGKLEPALAAALKAVEEGITDPGLYVLCSQLLEREERFDEAEALLKRLPTKGCGGSTHPLLAEYWLRRSKNLNKALDSFKGVLQQERDNPRWPLRIAQVYAAKGWHKEAAAQAEQLMQHGKLPEPFNSELKALADQLQNR